MSSSRDELVAALERAIAQMEYDKPAAKGGGYRIGSRPASTRQELLSEWSYRVLQGGK